MKLDNRRRDDGSGLTITRRALGCLAAGRLLGRATPRRDLTPVAVAALADWHGFVLAQDVSTGELLAGAGLKHAAIRVAHPGSSIKPFVLKALIDSGRYRDDLAFPCSGKLRLAGRNFACSHPHLTRPLVAEEALAYSCNTWFARAAQLLPPVELANALRSAGLARCPGLTPVEAPGRIETVSDGEQSSLQALGEFHILLTPVGLLSGYRNLAKLRLAGEGRYGPIWRGLRGSVEYGTSQRAQPRGDAPVAGKTGTATKRDSPGRHAWFAGYAPADAPRLVVVVFLEDGLGGSDAAPVAEKIFSVWLGQ